MTRRLLTIVLALIPLVRAAGDIAPAPVKAMGIVPEGPIEIRMVSEKVVAELYKDSSVVECMFVLKNDGKATKLSIGFPEMNFYHWRPVPDKVPASFEVFVNGNGVSTIEIYRPVNPEPASVNASQPALDAEEKPWLLWDSHFDENELKTVTVRYTLPHGALRNDKLRYFSYLLSTGAGWKGNIGHAEIIVKLMDLDYDLVVNVSPAGYTAERNQIRWTMTEFEPTADQDINIYYEKQKGEYKEWLVLNPNPAYFIDGKKVFDGDLFDRHLNPFRKLNPEDILSVSIPRDSQKEIYGYESVILVTTKNHVISGFVEKAIVVNPSLKLIQSLPYPDFIERYHLEIDGVHFEGKEMLERLPGIEFSDKIKIKARESGDGTIAITIRTKQKD